MVNEGYFRSPTIYGSTVVFVSEDDLWSVPVNGGVARRLTSGLGDILLPRFSRDGKLLAFTSREEGHPEVFVMGAEGGPARRLTFLGANSIVRSWTNEGRIIFSSDAGQPFQFRVTELHSVSTEGDLPQKLPFGPAADISLGPNGGVVLGRNTADPARWKRYRGGTAGHLWIDVKGNGKFQRILTDLSTNIGSPMWIGKRIFFISDHEGAGNIYSCRPDGRDLRRHTDHGEYYARFPSTDGATIVYQCGAEIYSLDPEAEESERIEIQLVSPRTQRNRKFVAADSNLIDFNVHPKGHSISVEARGKAFSMPLWEEAVRQYGKRDGVRYRHGQWLHDEESFVTFSDEDEEEHLEIYGPDVPDRRAKLSIDVGRPFWVVPSPNRKQLAVANHRMELVLVDVEKKKAEVIDKSDYARIQSPDWSPDGRWIAYSFGTSANTMAIKLANVEDGETYIITRPDFRDVYPSFDPEGRYLYFLSYRFFNPVYDQHYFDLGFPRAVKPMLVTLREDIPSPFVPVPKGFGPNLAEKEEKKAEKEGGAKTKKPRPDTKIDLDGIGDRVLAFPMPEGQYTQIRGIKGKVLMTVLEPEGALGRNWFLEEEPKARIEAYDLSELNHETLVSGVSYFKVSADHSTLVYRAGRKLRALKAGDKPGQKQGESRGGHQGEAGGSNKGDAPGRKTGWIDLGRIKISVDPPQEWNQMLREAWRLMRDNFWVPEMSGVDWSLMFKKYQVLIDKVGSRQEFSDLIWEMQGELGTSHAYELGGDYRQPPSYTMGQLAADIGYDPRKDRYFFTHIVRGDSWDESRSSPLAAPGVAVKEGDAILAIGGQEVGNGTAPHQLLVNQADQFIELLVSGSTGRKTRRVVVKALRDQTPARYREWVEANRALVHERTKGRIGYVHIPDMGAPGYSEFHRYYKTEVDRDGLIIDFRFNSGGHVSELILEKLARSRVGYVLPRWGDVRPYPHDSAFGPIVALTNELAGSDGDIASHCFKLLGIGPLVGKRTWGGVIGISPTHRLVDGSLTTQPEHSFWFRDVGFGVENYGTDPDYDVDIRPQDYASGVDTQMKKALELITKELKKNPPKRPNFSKKPVLVPPELPPRPKR